MRSILWLFLCVPSLTFAQKPLPAPMPLFMESVKRLQPYMVSERAFADPKNEKAIQEELNKLAAASKNLMHEDRISEPVLKKSAANIQQHLADLSDSFKSSKSYARFLLNSTLDGCSSCHSQISPAKHPFMYIEAKDLQGSSFERAEFLFAIRQFEKALKEYQKVLIADEMRHKTDAFVRGLSIYLRHFRDLDGAEKWTKAFPIKHDDEKPIITKHLADLQNLKAEKIPSIEKSDDAAIAAFAKPSLNKNGTENLVRKLYVSGLLHAYVLANADAKKQTSAAIYYSLGRADAALKESFIFSLIDDYFKRCIDLEPKSKQAKTCAEELEISVTTSYEGSSGLHLPDDQAKILNDYRVKAGLKKKKYSN